MGKAARGKHEQREAGPLPERFAFGPQFLTASTAQLITAEPDTTAIFEVHCFGETRERPCPQCGGDVIYKYGNWLCISLSDVEFFTLCTWTSAREVPQGKATLEKCPECGGKIIYNGNYFCENLGGEPLDCHWALPHPPRREADKDLALRLTGGTS
jgi:predicted RNA-binding Zn-ribbon protein involved in translation (DUF1610 family)